jgi:hypothetical protein
MAAGDKLTGGWTDRFRALGGLWIVYGIVRLIMAAFLVIFSGTATLMFGALLGRVANPFVLMDDFHFVYVLMIVLSVICGILGIVVGLALLGGRSGRAVALIAALFSLCEIPLGLTLGVYTLVVLLPARAVETYGGARP